MLKLAKDIQELKTLVGQRKSAVTIGNFDGCHLGHQELFQALSGHKVLSQSLSVAITFDPHPAKALGFTGRIERLQTLSQRLERMGELGVDIVAVIPFTLSLASLSPEEFVEEFIVQGANAAFVAVGNDFRFGKSRAGSVEDLKQFGEEFGFVVDIIPPRVSRGEVVSSTLIRRCLSEHGNLSRANELLGRPWTFLGTVVEGKQLGRTLGFPTANLDVEEFVVLKQGVYAGWAEILGVKSASDRLPMVMNVGRRPTVDTNSFEQKIEVHLIDFENRSLYGDVLRITPQVSLREEQRFSSLNDLKTQIARDVRKARQILGL